MTKPMSDATDTTARQASPRAGWHLANLPRSLRHPRSMALWILGSAIIIVTVASFVLSYRGLVHYALGIGIPPWLAWAYPAIFDLPVVAGEVVLFVAAIEGKTAGLVRAWAWVITIGFAGLSVAANAGVLPARAGLGLPPAVLAVVLGFGLGEVKRQAAKYRRHSATNQPRSEDRPRSTAVDKPGDNRPRRRDQIAEQTAIRAYRRHRAGGGRVMSAREIAAQWCGGNRRMAARVAEAVA